MLLDEPLRDRVGRFEVPYAMIKARPDVVRRLLGETIVVRAEMIAATWAIEYDAYCEAFEVVEEGSTIPHYDITYDEAADQVTWIRREDG